MVVLGRGRFLMSEVPLYAKRFRESCMHACKWTSWVGLKMMLSLWFLRELKSI